MAKIGDIFIGGKEPDTVNKEYYPCGIAFLLRSEATIDYIYKSQDSRWQVEIKKNHNYIVSRSRDIQTYDNLIISGLKHIQRCLDIIAIKGWGILILDHPEIDHIAVFQRKKEAILKFFSIATLPVKIHFSAEIRDKHGNVKHPPKIPEPDWIWAFRYYRLSQASQDIFEAYRNLFLSFESLLNLIRPKSTKEHEREWLIAALSDIATRIKIAEYVPDKSKEPIKSFIKIQYTNIRCRLFHAKQPDALLPHEELNPIDVMIAYEALLKLWHDIAKAYLQVTRGDGVVTYQGFKWWMDKLSSHTLSFHFTEDDSLPKKEDTHISPRGLNTYKIEQLKYLHETNPGIVSWQGETNLLDIHKGLSIHRVCSMIDTTLLDIYYIKNGLSPSGVDIFEIYHSMRLLNINQPKTTF